MYRSPITDANFPEAWEYGCRKYRRMRKTTVIRKLIVPLSQFLFFLCFLILGYGVVYDGFQGPIRSFLQKIPYAEDLWLQISSLILGSDSGMKLQLGRMAGFLYGVPLAGAVICWLLVLLVYHPAKPTLSINPELHSRDLRFVGQELSQYEPVYHSSTLTFFSVLFCLLLLGGCMSFMTHYRNDPAVLQLLGDGWAQAGLYFVLTCLVIFILYQILNLPLRILVSMFYCCRISGEFPEDTRDYDRRKALPDLPEEKKES